MLCQLGIPSRGSHAICRVWHHGTDANMPYRRPMIVLGYCVSQQPAVVQSKKGSSVHWQTGTLQSGY